MEEIMIKRYAPIIIPTLNRVEHLKRCIKSLSANTGVFKTEIYISVDYPPSEKYVEGYRNVIDYLKHTSDLKAFKKSNIFYQECNLGPKKNFLFLKDKVKEKYDSYIATEDDNEFSPNFLDYINKGLILFENSPNVMSINGQKDTEYNFGENNVTGSKLFPAYGYGTWFAKEEQLESDMKNLLLSPEYFHPRKAIKLFRQNKYMFALYINGIICSNTGLFWNENNELYACDTVRAIYMYFTNSFCVVPQVSKSRTWGNDGSGVNMPNTGIDPTLMWKLDTEPLFYYCNNNVNYEKCNDRATEKYLSLTFGHKLILISMCEYILLVLMGFKREKLIKLRRGIQKWSGLKM